MSDDAPKLTTPKDALASLLARSQRLPEDQEPIGLPPPLPEGCHQALVDQEGGFLWMHHEVGSFTRLFGLIERVGFVWVGLVQAKLCV